MTKPQAKTPEEGLNEEERREIEQQIEKLFTERRIVLEQEPNTGQKLSSGALFPVMANIVVFAALVGGFWFLVLPNWSTEEMAHSADVNYATTEAFVVERVREQAEQELSAQEQRIAEIRRELEQLREQEAAFPGTNEQAGERTAQLQEELNRLIAEMEQQRSQAELQQGEITSSFEARLDKLQQRQDEQRFVLNQLGFTYQAVDSHLSSGNSSAAIEELNRADQFLSDYAEGVEGAFASTISVLAQGNGALREALELFQDASEVDPRETEQPARLERAAALVEEADALLASGNEQEAEELYRNALTTLDPTERAFQQVESLDAGRLAAERAELRDQLEAARDQASVREQQLRQEIAELESALDEAEAALASARDTEQTEQPLASREQELSALRSRAGGLELELERSRERIALLESRIEARSRSITTLQSEVREELAAVRTALSREMGDSLNVVPDRLESLLETKTLIREVLNSELVRREHPELYLEMELYFDALGESRVAQGRKQGLYGAVAAIRELMEGIGIATATEISSMAGTDELRAALAEELFALVQGVLRQAR